MRCKTPIRKAMAMLEGAMSKGLILQEMYISGRGTDVDVQMLEWHDSNKDLLTQIFEGSEPIVRYLPVERLYAHLNEIGLSEPNTPTLDHRQFLVSRLKVLGEFYRELERMCGTPLTFIESKKQIRYMDQVCSLGTNNNGVYLVEYMFDNYDFNEHVLIDDVASYMEVSVQAVKNAVDDVNKKTNKDLGFSILSKPRGEIALIDKTPINNYLANNLAN